MTAKVCVIYEMAPALLERVAWEVLAKRAGYQVVVITASESSMEKGESVRDTMITLLAYAPDALIVVGGDPTWQLADAQQAAREGEGER